MLECPHPFGQRDTILNQMPHGLCKENVLVRNRLCIGLEPEICSLVGVRYEHGGEEAVETVVVGEVSRIAPYAYHLPPAEKLGMASVKNMSSPADAGVHNLRFAT